MIKKIAWKILKQTFYKPLRFRFSQTTCTQMAYRTFSTFYPFNTESESPITMNRHAYKTIKKHNKKNIEPSLVCTGDWKTDSKYYSIAIEHWLECISTTSKTKDRNHGRQKIKKNDCVPAHIFDFQILHLFKGCLMTLAKNK